MPTEGRMRESWAPLCRKSTLATTVRRRESARSQDECVALATRTAERGHGVAGAPPCQLESGVQGDPRSRHADRVADGDGSAVDVDLLRIDAEFLRRSQRDRGERLVDLDDVELVDRDALAGNGLLDRVRRLRL